MHISPLEEYGIRCMLQVTKGVNSEPVSASRIAEHEKLSIEYVSKIMFLLRKAGLVTSVRGVQGGFFLGKSLNEITLKKIFEAVQPAVAAESDEEFCRHYAGHSERCVHRDEECLVRPVWNYLFDYFDELLGTLTLEDLLKRQNEIEARVHALAIAKAQGILAASAQNQNAGLGAASVGQQ